MAVDTYLSELRGRTEAAVDTLGVYAGGSYALGAYEHGRSDLDVAVVTRRPLARAEKERLVASVRHEALPCPARGLELVVYDAAAAGSTGVAPAFELNLNTGARMPFRLDLEPDPGEGHWFAIDRAILRANGLALAGPPPATVFGAIPRHALLGVVADSLRWHATEAAAGDDAVLNACRALRFAFSDVWSSKPAAARWALDYVVDPDLVREALAARAGDAPPGRGAAQAFVAGTLAEIELLRALERTARARLDRGALAR